MKGLLKTTKRQPTLTETAKRSWRAREIIRDVERLVSRSPRLLSIPLEVPQDLRISPPGAKQFLVNKIRELGVKSTQ